MCFKEKKMLKADVPVGEKDILLLQPASDGNPKKGRRGSMCLSEEQLGLHTPWEQTGVQGRMG